MLYNSIVTETQYHLWLSTIVAVAPKATIIAVAKKREPRPVINFFGSDLRKSSSAYRVVRISKNINKEVKEENKASASEIASVTKLESLYHLHCLLVP